MRLCTPSLMAGLILVVAVSMAQETPRLEEEYERINYSLGHQIGMDFKRQGVELDSAALTRGIDDALAGAEPLVPGEDMEHRLIKLKGQITEDMHSDQLQRIRKRDETKERLHHEAQVFLEENAGKPGVETLSSGLQYRVIRDGNGVAPTRRDEVTIRVRGRRLDGKEFGNVDEENKPRTVSVRDMIPGIREAVLMMQPGAKWELYIPPELAYGRHSPLAYQAVIIELELLAVGGESKTTTPPGPVGTQDAQQP